MISLEKHGSLSQVVLISYGEVILSIGSSLKKTVVVFRTPAELKMVSWLEVTGSYDKIEPGKTYRIGFKISLTADATGWDQAPVFMSAKIGKKGKTIWKRIKSLNNNIEKLKRRTGPVNIPDDTDGRFEVFVSPNITINQDTKLQFGLYEVWTGKWKTGLLIYEAFVEEV
ncbi:PREDICTED: protein PHLOEM PROTEIN 2-LIKE A9 isoform X2 [Camelina sativa]|uniref:Protein PHLOEM PROTEIN 2-LIKE A9 isoform X2 n=1 Tax=Camelina sativa TaxID=90675 RepID=A0ABM1RIT3_CAMSA|nr:PREDICTED: protein PHLOEM PROTEIN 2-LIKE A9 isoform X2 [Camelina sativa]